MSFAAPDRTANFNRPPRIPLSDIPAGEVVIPPPPQVPDLPPQSLLIAIIPVLGISVMMLFFVLRTVGDDSGGLLLALPLALLAAITVGGSVMIHRMRRTDHQRRQAQERLAYLRLLERKRARLQAAHDAYRAIMERNYRHPREGLQDALVRDPGIWERRPEDADFATTRLGIGRLPIPVRISVPDPDRGGGDELARALALAETYRFIEDVPLTASLHDQAPLGFFGDRKRLLGLTRAVLGHLALTHAPQDLHITVFCPSDHYEDWRWLTWLPHVSQQEESLSPDLIASEPAQARNLLGYLSQVIDARQNQKSATGPFILVVFDGLHLVENEAVLDTILHHGASINAAALCLSATFAGLPGACQSVVEVNAHGHLTWTGGRADCEGRADSLAVTDAEHLARALAGIQTATPRQNDRIPRSVQLLELYGVQRVEDLLPQVRARWRREIPDGVLPFPVPIGRESLAVETLLALDDDHHGPHGVLAGTTGAGKSEFLQTLVCTLALEHDPRLVNFLLIDFKGGSTFNVFADLPHTVGMVTNLDGTLVKRVLEALKAETQQRQQVLKQLNVRDITQYHRFYGHSLSLLTAPDYHPLPHLFVLVDEFAQLSREMPAFLNELVRTAQVGRSLGLHLILGTQSPMEVMTDEMNDNLQFRICLRVQNTEASRAMLRRPDAAYLPAGLPGRGYFQVGERGLFKQFQTAYVGGDYPPEGEDSQGAVRLLQIITDGGAAIDLLPRPDSEGALAEEPHTVARAIVRTLRDTCARQHIPAPAPLLLPPLAERLGLEAVLGDVGGGWNGSRWLPVINADGLTVPPGSAPIGVVDDVFRRVQHPLWLHFSPNQDASRSGGHMLITGGVGTGKTTALRTLLLCLGLLHSPEDLHIYIISMMGSGLNDLGELPHAEPVIHGTQAERVRRLFTRLIHLLEERQAGHQTAGPVVVLAIDQFEGLRDTFYEPHLPVLERLINEGHGVGIYLVLTATGVTAVPERLRALMPQRLALASGNPTDYVLTVGPLRGTDPEELPRGRGYLPGNPPLKCQICLPARAAHLADEALLTDMRALIQEMRSGYRALTGQEQSPTPVQTLPRLVPLAELAAPDRMSATDTTAIFTPLGLNDDDTLSTFALDWSAQGPHFLVVGPAGTGKTTLLHTAILAAAQQFSPWQLRFLLVDFMGRSFRKLAPLKHTLNHVTDAAGLRAQLEYLRGELAALPAGRTSAQKTVVMIDNYDLLSDTLGPASPVLDALRDLARQPAELGVHIWAAGYYERVGDPFLRQLLLVSAGFGLGSRDSLYALHMRPSHLSAESLPPGRAYFAQYRQAQMIQIARGDTRQLVETINRECWPDAPTARWSQPPRPLEESPYATRQPPAGSIGLDTEGLIHDLLGRIDEDEP